MLRMFTLAQLITLIVVVSLVGLSSAASPMAISPDLGMADSFAVLAYTEITNIPTSAITGDVGLSPATGAGIGLTCAEVTGTIYSVDAYGPLPCRVTNAGLLTTAKTDLSNAYDALSAGDNTDCTIDYGAITQELGGLTLVPGVYCANAFTLSGILTLNGADTDVWIFRSASTLITSGAAEIVLSTGGIPCEVWWKVGSSATLGTNTSLAGNILALTSISLATGANLDGRALASNGAVTLAKNTIAIPICALDIPIVTTEIHDASCVEVTSAPVGTIVHDMATVTGTVGMPMPTGTVTFTVYHNQTCSEPGTFAGAVPLDVEGVAHPSDEATLTDAGLSYLAHYGGDRNYDAADGPCEVLVPEPTAVELLYFQANPLSGQQVQLQWATALEVDNFGFNLYRADVDDLGRASLIHFEPAVTQGGSSGATYVYVDTAPYAGPWWYWLSDVDTYGRETFHDTPRNITVQSKGYRVYLPFIGK